ARAERPWSVPARPRSRPAWNDSSRSCRCCACASGNAGSLAAEILGPVEGDERSAAEPTERLAHHGFDQQLLDALEAGREQSRVRAVEHVPDVIVGRDFLNSEQGLAVRPSLAPLQRPLEGQK